jgi:hypothetical protein
MFASAPHAVCNITEIYNQAIKSIENKAAEKSAKKVKLKDVQSDVQDLISKSITDKNTINLTRHNVRIGDISDLTQGSVLTTSFSIPLSDKTREALAVAGMEDENKRSSAVPGLTDEDIYDMVELMKRSLKNFLKLGNLNIEVSVNKNTGLKQIKLTAYITRGEFVKNIQGHYKVEIPPERANDSLTLMLIISCVEKQEYWKSSYNKDGDKTHNDKKWKNKNDNSSAEGELVIHHFRAYSNEKGQKYEQGKTGNESTKSNKSGKSHN